MQTACRAAVLVVLGLGPAGSAQADGKLDRARDDIRSPSRDDDDDDDSWLRDLVEGFIQSLFDSDDDGSDDREDPAGSSPAPELWGFGYRSYPYQRSGDHFIVSLDRETALAPGMTRSDVEPSFAPVHAQPIAGQLALEGGHWDGLTRTVFQARLLTETRVELDARALWLHEPASDQPDALLGDGHFSFRFAQTHALLVRVGFGVRFWADAELESLGLDALLGMDWFPVRPLVVSAQVSGGNLGHAGVASARLQLGVALRRLELLAGVEWLRIGEADLSTPLLGLRIWL